MMTAWLVVKRENGKLGASICYDDLPTWWPRRNKIYGYGNARCRLLSEAEQQLSFEDLRAIGLREYPTMPSDASPCKCGQRTPLAKPFRSLTDPTKMVVGFEPECRLHKKPVKAILGTVP